MRLSRSSRAAVLVAATVALLLPAVPVGATSAVFEVDTVVELYNAVAVPGARVRIAPGSYVLDAALDPTVPQDGRLDLADGVSLRGPSALSAGPHRLPVADSSGGPVWSGAPAIIDGSGLAPDTFGLGVVVVGYKGSVEGVWVRGSVEPGSPDPFAGFLGRPGIEIVSRGSATGNVVERATLGIRVRSDSDEDVRGRVAGNFVMDSGLMGVVAIPVPSTDGERTSRSTITATFTGNRILRSGANGILIVGGLSGDDNVVTARTSDNVVQYAGLGMYVEIRGGGGLAPDPGDIRGASRNRIVLTSTRDSFDGVAVAYLVEGAIREYLADPNGGPPLIGEESNDNSTIATIHKASIQNAAFFDIVAQAAATADFPPPPDAPVSGYNNTVTLTLRGIQGSGVPLNVLVGDSTPYAPNSGNDAVIVGSRKYNEETNTGLDFTSVEDGDFTK